MNMDLNWIYLQTAAAALVAWLGYALLLGTLLAVLTWGLLRVLRGKMLPGLEAALWSIVLIKFLVPFGPGWSLSLASVYERLSPYPTGVAVAAERFEARARHDAAAQTDAAALSAAGSGQPWRDWTMLIAAGYVAGVVVLSVLRVQAYRRLRARCLALPAADAATQKLVRRVCRQVDVLREPLVRIGDEPGAPFVMGLFRPVMVLARRQLVRPDELETVVVHEVTHLRRGDLFVRILQWIAGTLLFFWPIVAWANRRIDRVREQVCDEWALRHGRLTAGEYARCLLSAAQPVHRHWLRYQPTGMAGSPSTIERRIDVILALTGRPRGRPIWGLLAIAFVLAWSGFALAGAGGGKKPAADKPKYQATQEDMDRHAQEVYARVNQHAAGDLDGDGAVNKEECWAFVAAVVLQRPQAVLEKYPFADHNQDGQLDGTEAYFFGRGDYDLEKLHKEMQSAVEEAKQAGDTERLAKLKKKITTAEIATWHVILDRRSALLDMLDHEPSAAEVRAIADEAARQAALGDEDKLDQAIKDVAKLRAEAARLRAEAADSEGAEAEEHAAKAAKVERKAADLAANIAAKLKEQIAKLEAAGQTAEAARLRAKLAELESE